MPHMGGISVPIVGQADGLPWLLCGRVFDCPYCNGILIVQECPHAVTSVKRASEKVSSGGGLRCRIHNRKGWDALGNCHTGVAHHWRFIVHYFMFHIGDYLKATAHLTQEEDLAYRRLLDIYYDTESPISPEIALVARRIRCQPQAVENVLKEFFTPTAAGWVNSRAEKEITQYKLFSTAGKKGAAIRWGKTLEDSPPITPPIATINHKPKTITHTSMVTNPILDTSISNIVEEKIAPLKPTHSPPITSLLPAQDQGKAWAYRLKEREEAGEELTIAQKNNWRQALRVRT